MNGIADKAEDAARNQHMRTLYGLTKTLCNERSRRSGAVLDKEGDLLSSMEHIQARWTEHFKEILNREAPTNPIGEEEDNGFEFTDTNEEIATNEPTLGEVQSAMGKLKNGKSPETDSITAELVQAGGKFSAKKIHQLLKNIWKYENNVPTKWKQELIIKLPKKGM